MTGEVLDQTAIDDAAADADFNAGFKPEEGLTETPEPDTTPEPAADAEPAEPAPVEPPELASITKADWDALTAKAAAVDEIKAAQQSRDDKVFGHIGNLKQTIESLRTAATTGQPVEITDEDFAEFRSEYPELADLQVKGLTKVLGRLRLGGVPTQEIETQVATRTAAVRSELIDAQLDAVVGGDWIAERNSDAFLAWEKSWTDKEKALNNSDSLRDASSLMRLFVQHKSAPKPKAPTPEKPAPSARQRVLSAAVNPRGTVAHATAPSPDDEFTSAFEKGR